MKYRREIDGLRAIAVLPVILFHAGFNAFSGGFVGVDIFFVISGYLITTIILVDKEKGRFSLANFYERRARRILPALFFVILCCFPFAWLWLLPNHLKDFSKSLIAVSAFSSNVLFWLESGYFATATELKPLIHTWSLSVEEQYYVLFPLFLMVMWKFRKRWIFGSLAAIAVTSLALAQWGAYNEPAATFFLLPTRAWELAIGALIAFYFLYKQDHKEFVMSHKTASEAFGLLGIVLICYSIFAFDSSTPFPSLYALIPTLGTGLIIVFSTPQTFVGRLLGTKAMVGIGLISYSTYLWHQPLFVFARHRSLTEPSASLIITLSLLSFVFAFLSWRYIEMPFRNKEAFTRKKIFNFAIVISVAFILIGLVGNSSEGWSSRVPDDTYASVKNSRENVAPLERTQLIAAESGDGYDDSIIYLVGDSFAGQLSSELSKEAQSLSLSFGESLLAGCPPVLGFNRRIHDTDCGQYNTLNYRIISSIDKVKNVIVVANWTGYLEKNEIDREKLLNMYIASVEQLLKTGKKIILVYPIPMATQDVPDYILKSSFLYGNSLKKMSPRHGSSSHQNFKERNRHVYQAFDSLKNSNNLIKIFPEQVFCDSFVKDRCVVQNNGEIFYSDNVHLSSHGAKLVVNQIMKQIGFYQEDNAIVAKEASE